MRFSRAAHLLWAVDEARHIAVTAADLFLLAAALLGNGRQAYLADVAAPDGAHADFLVVGPDGLVGIGVAHGVLYRLVVPMPVASVVVRPERPHLAELRVVAFGLGGARDARA